MNDQITVVRKKKFFNFSTKVFCAISLMVCCSVNKHAYAQNYERAAWSYSNVLINADADNSNTDENIYFKIGNINGNDWQNYPEMVIKRGAKIGINTNDPQDMLHLQDGRIRLGEDYFTCNDAHGNDGQAKYLSLGRVKNKCSEFSIDLKGPDTRTYGSNGIYAGPQLAINADVLKIGTYSATSGALTEVARFASNGNMGIGTIYPDSKLHVNGSVKIVNGTQGAGKVLTSDANGLATWQTPGSTSSQGVTIANNNGGSINRLFLAGTDSSHYIYSTGSKGNKTIIAEWNSEIDFLNTNPSITNPIAFAIRGNGYDNLNSHQHTHIGIGNGAPKITLDAYERAIIGTSNVNNNQHDPANRGEKVSFGAVLGTTTSEFTGMRVVNAAGTRGCGNTSDITFNTWECNTSNSREVMRINGSGNVGIGIASPRSKFDVMGDATFNDTINVGKPTQVSINTTAKLPGIALTVGGATYIGDWRNVEKPGLKPGYSDSAMLWVEKAIVTPYVVYSPAYYYDSLKKTIVPAWKDEVFADDYKLPTLTEVESFIKQNKHLPGIPSEAEVKKRGYTSREIDLGFLEKIEHLMLYSIDQDKKIKAMQVRLDEMTELKKEIADLKEIIKNK